MPTMLDIYHEGKACLTHTLVSLFSSVDITNGNEYCTLNDFILEEQPRTTKTQRQSCRTYVIIFQSLPQTYL